MRRLLLLRHAKSSWTDASLRDHDRPLNGRGRAAAPRMGAFLRDQGLVPDLVLCSSALRTCETLARLGLPDTIDVEVTRDLYLADATTVLDLVAAVDATVGTLMVVGHNPTTHEVAVALTGAGDAGTRSRLAAKYPTGALAVLTIPGPWSEIGPGGATLDAFVTPHDLD